MKKLSKGTRNYLIKLRAYATEHKNNAHKKLDNNDIWGFAFEIMRAKNANLKFAHLLHMDEDKKDVTLDDVMNEINTITRQRLLPEIEKRLLKEISIF